MINDVQFLLYLSYRSIAHPFHRTGSLDTGKFSTELNKDAIRSKRHVAEFPP